MYTVEFSKDEISAEERKPKKKHAVMLGYSGTGYKGMQLNNHEKTIEGDVFSALVAAGAISKANADDPKKSSLVRCARTDKGVHAAGNVLSLKLITGDEGVVQKINENLPAQIRVYGIERTNKSFNAYHAVGSRVYEYLIPTHCFLPPHPRSFLGRQLYRIAKDEGDLEGLQKRQAEVSEFWNRTEEEHVKPALQGMDETLKSRALQAIFEGWHSTELDAVGEASVPAAKSQDGSQQSESTLQPASENSTKTLPKDEDMGSDPLETPDQVGKSPFILTPLQEAVRTVKAAYLAAKLSYRVDPTRQERVRKALNKFNGTHNFHNYTVRKNPRDPSASRHMKSVTCADAPIELNGTEWLSIRIHGQSFMMHQIRKMVSMVALVVRCGTRLDRIKESLYAEHKLAIPKAPGVGLLLERPVFDNYNERMKFDTQTEREPVGFEKYEREMEDFKRKEIYTRVFSSEAEQAFHLLFMSLDQFRSSQLLYLSSKGVEGVKIKIEDEASTRTEVDTAVNNVVSLQDVDGEDEDNPEQGDG